jgi:adenylate cyclase class 2
MAQEIEIKIRIEDAKNLRAALKRLGARPKHKGTGRVHEWNTLFDTARQELRKHEQLLRTRIETPAGKPARHEKKAAQPALLTFKGPVGSGRGGGSRGREQHKRREEIQFQIGDEASLEKILAVLGLRPSAHYEKYRTAFALPKSKSWAKGFEIELDETPIGTFIELEGPPKAIDRAAKELGFSKKDYILKNYLQLNAEECRRRGLKPGDMVFQKRK